MNKEFRSTDGIEAILELQRSYGEAILGRDGLPPHAKAMYVRYRSLVEKKADGQMTAHEYDEVIDLATKLLPYLCFRLDSISSSNH